MKTNDLSNEERTKPIISLTEADVNRFWSRAQLTANDEKCWNWTGFLQRGYGNFHIKTNKVGEKKPHKKFITSRVAYFIGYKIDPIGKIVMHSCDNPSCVNPKHLFLGTSKNNTQDMMVKGRNGFQIGSEHHGAKLTETDVVEIRKRFKNGETQKSISKDYNVSQSLISLVISMKYWKHI